jgi:hypothetical protein
LAVAGSLGTVIDNVERIRKAYMDGEEIPKQVPAVIDCCKTMKRSLEEHPSQDSISAELREQVERMAEEINELAKNYCLERPPAASRAVWSKIILNKVEATRRFVNFPTDTLETFRSAEQLLLKVLGLMTHDEVHRGFPVITARLEALSMEVHSAQLCDRYTFSIEDRWVGGNRSLPSEEVFMLGTDKLRAIADLKHAVVGCKSGGVVAAVGVQGMGGVGKTPPV